MVENIVTETLEETPVVEETVEEVVEAVVEEAPQSTLKDKPSAEKIQTDVQSRLGKRSDTDDVFVPATSAVVEKAAKEVASQQGFDYNRGTSVGARLMARAKGIQ